MQDHFADGRLLPPIDESQDWFLISGEEDHGFAVLEFSRNLTTCDPRDLDIKVWLYVLQANTVYGDGGIRIANVFVWGTGVR